MSEFRNSGNIFFNLPIPNPSYKKSVSSIVVGHCGVGKSRLVNNLCGSNQKVGICSGSLTQDLFCGDCKYSSNSYKTTFSIYDSPGVTPSDQRGVILLKRALRHLKWNLVIILAKLQSRFEDRTIVELKKLQKLFKNQTSRVVFLVSHADIFDQTLKPAQRNKIILEFLQVAKSYKLGRVILFSNQKSDFKFLSHLLYCCAENSEADIFDVEDKSFRSLGFKQINDKYQEFISQCKEEISKRQRQQWIPAIYQKLQQIQNEHQQKDIRQLLMMYIKQLPNQNTQKDQRKYQSKQNNAVLKQDKLVTQKQKNNQRQQKFKRDEKIYKKQDKTSEMPVKMHNLQTCKNNNVVHPPQLHYISSNKNQPQIRSSSKPSINNPHQHAQTTYISQTNKIQNNTSTYQVSSQKNNPRYVSYSNVNQQRQYNNSGQQLQKIYVKQGTNQIGYSRQYKYRRV